MKIVFLNGGLANQTFQYIFYRYGQIHRPDEEWILDDSFFFIHNVHNGYELKDVFGLYPRLLSQTFDNDVWEYMLKLKKDHNKSIPQLLLENGMDICMIAETNNWKQWNPFEGDKRSISLSEYSPDIINMSANVYYHGYWINSNWFKVVEKELRSELLFRDIDEVYNQEYIYKIKNSESCAIHIRRGDYVDLGIAATDSLYREWIMMMMEHAPKMTLFVFSDDLGYCRLHKEELGLTLPLETVFVEGNDGKMSFRDMQLMSCCKYMIYVNSSFSYLAALLNTNLRASISQNNRIL